MEPQPNRARLSPLELLAACLCLIYGGLLVVITLRTKEEPSNIVVVAVALVSFLGAFTLLRGDRRLASACQYVIALCWLLSCLLLLGILALCGNRDAPGFWSVLLWAVGTASLAILHFVCARHTRSRGEE